MINAADSLRSSRSSRNARIPTRRSMGVDREGRNQQTEVQELQTTGFGAIFSRALKDDRRHVSSLCVLNIEDFCQVT